MPRVEKTEIQRRILADPTARKQLEDALLSGDGEPRYVELGNERYRVIPGGEPIDPIELLDD